MRSLIEKQGESSSAGKVKTLADTPGARGSKVKSTGNRNNASQLQNDSSYITTLVQGFRNRLLALKVAASFLTVAIVAGGAMELNHSGGNVVLSYITQALLLVLGVVSLIDAATMK